MPQLPRGSLQGNPLQSRSIDCCTHQRQVSYADGKDILNQEDLDFLSHHISVGTRGTYRRVWTHFCKFCVELNIDPETCFSSNLSEICLRPVRNWGLIQLCEYCPVHREQIFYQGVPGLGPFSQVQIVFSSPEVSIQAETTTPSLSNHV